MKGTSPLITEVPDLRGDLVTVGDTIAYGAVDGRSGMIRIGQIIEIVGEHEKKPYSWADWTEKVPTKIRVQVEFSSGWSVPEKPVLIQADFKRFVKVAH